MENNIKIIDVFGSSDSRGAEHHYSYFTPNYSLYSGWSKYVSDLREELAPGIQECYCCFCTSEGWWISKIIRNPHDLREDPIMVSICIGENRPKSGKKAVELLNGFVDFFIIQKTWNDEETEKKLLNEDQEFELVPCALVESALPTLNHKSAYRTYSSIEELSECISFLPQQGYEKYSRIFFAPKENSGGMPIECIDETIPLRRIYTLHYPEDCSSPSGKVEIMEGEELKLVYTKQGLEPFEKHIKGGETTDFAYVEGDSMYIRSGKDLGLVHNRVVEIICKDERSNRIDGFALDNYTRQNKEITIAGKKVILPEKITQEAIVRVDPADNQYEPVKVNLTDETESPIVLILEPKKYKVVFRMNDRTFETIETMNPSEVNAKWSDYDSDIDDYAGVVYFRAHRIKNDSKHQFVNGDKDLPIGKRIGNFFKDWWLHLLIVLLTLLLLGYGIYAAISLFRNGEKPWPFGTKNEVVYENNKGGQAPVLTEGEEKEVGEQEVKTIDSMAFYVQQDIDYLVREKKLWTKDNIRTKEYQELFDNISNGRIEEVIMQYDALLGNVDKTNNTIKMIVDGLVRLRQTGNQSLLREASDEMKRLSKSGSINLDELLTSINMIVNKSQSSKPKEEVTKSSATSSTNSSGQNTNTPTERPKSD